MEIGLLGSDGLMLVTSSDACPGHLISDCPGQPQFHISPAAFVNKIPFKILNQIYNDDFLDMIPKGCSMREIIDKLKPIKF